MRNRSKTAVWIVITVIALLVAQQAPFVMRRDYSRRVVWESTSPDKRYRLEVRRQAAFPAFRDPSAMAYFAAINARTGRPVAGIGVPLHRFSDFKGATVEWSSGDVQAVNFDQRQPASVRLVLPH